MTCQTITLLIDLCVYFMTVGCHETNPQSLRTQLPLHISECHDHSNAGTFCNTAKTITAQKDYGRNRQRQRGYGTRRACHRDATVLKTAEEGIILLFLRRAWLHCHWQILLLLQPHTACGYGACKRITKQYTMSCCICGTGNVTHSIGQYTRTTGIACCA